MRGKAFWGIHIVICQGITPAYAGKSACKTAVQVGSRDHPRLCGEKKVEAALDTAFSGSPPPMRGKVQNCFRSLCSVGITPAYAGKSDKATERNLFREDHPRLCGEKQNYPFWGIHIVRITPAYAGKRITNIIFFAVIWDHPRLCGEKVSTELLQTFADGSPPPMRGKVSEKPPFAML